MVYMTFNSSCSYAGVANMLAQFGCATDDRTIAMGMHLPFLFTREGEVYMAGPMLQSAEWFNLYLNPIGFMMRETAVPAAALYTYLMKHQTAMLGIELEKGSKHAVVFTGIADGKLSLLNNKRKDDSSPERFLFTKSELAERVAPTVTVATLERISPVSVEFSERFRHSVCVIRENVADIRAVCESCETVGALRKKLNTLFRPLLLDGITMLSLLGKAELAGTFTALQTQFLRALRRDADTEILLGEHLSADDLERAAERYIELIETESASCQTGVGGIR